MNITKVGSQQTYVPMACIAAIIALFLTACGQDTVAGQAIAPATAGSTPAITSDVPIDAVNAPLLENPYRWVGSDRYDGPLHVDGLDLDLRAPIAEVRDHIDAVAYFKSRCVVVINGQYGQLPETYGVFVYNNPKDVTSMISKYAADAATAYAFVHGFDDECA